MLKRNPRLPNRQRERRRLLFLEDLEKRHLLAAPAVSSFLAEDVTFQHSGDSSYTFTVTFSDADNDVDVASIDVTDVTVTRFGGSELTVADATASPQVNSSPIVATYTVVPPGGSWDPSDDGIYSIALNDNAVQDALGAPVPGDSALATFVVDSSRLLNETFETDGNGTRYTTAGEFVAGPSDYFTRVLDRNGDDPGGESPPIDLDDATVDEYTGFDRGYYFAAEDVSAGGNGAAHRVLDLNPINTTAFTDLTFRGLFAAGDNTDGTPAYDAASFLAVLVSTDSGASYLPKLVFRSDVTVSDSTGFPARQVTTIMPGSDPDSDTLAELGAKLSAGQIMPNTAVGGADGQFDFMAADPGGTAAEGVTLGANLQSIAVDLDDATETRIRLVVQSGANNVEWAFDHLIIDGTPSGATAPSAQSVNAPDVGEVQIGDISYSFDITYTDDSAIDFSTIDPDDVTVTGPGGPLTITGATVDIASNGAPRIATYTFTPPGGSWDSADNGTYTIGIVGGEVGDDDSTQQFVPANVALATFEVDATNTPPTVAMFLAEDVIVPDFGETSYSFTIEYQDVAAIDVSSIDVSDVTVIGPGGPLTVTSAVETPVSGSNGSPRAATYTVTPPGGEWDASDAGSYTIGVVANQVLDVAGGSVAADPNLTQFSVLDNKLLNETFETDGSGTRYTTSGEFYADANGYFSRIIDDNGNVAGGELPSIDLDDEILDEYLDFGGRGYFAAEDLEADGDGFRVIDFDPILTLGFTNLSLSGLFGAGDTDANPAYDGDHFMAVLVSTDMGATYVPRLVFRSDVNATDSTNFPARLVTQITPGTDPTSDTLEELGAKLSAGQIMPNPATGGSDGQFDFLAADTGGTGATGLLLSPNLQTASVALDDATETRIRVVVQSSDLNVEWAFDDLMVTGDAAPEDVTIDYPLDGGTIELLLDQRELVAQVAGGTEIFRALAERINSLTFNGSDAVDALIVDFDGGDPVPGGGVLFEGGPGTDLLQVRGGSPADVTHRFTNASDGQIVVDGSTIDYRAIGPISDQLLAVDREFEFGDADDNVSFGTGADPGDDLLFISGNQSQAIEFVQPTNNLSLDLGGGNDLLRFDLAGADLPIIDGGPGNNELRVSGDGVAVDLTTGGDDIQRIHVINAIEGEGNTLILDDAIIQNQFPNSMLDAIASDTDLVTFLDSDWQLDGATVGAFGLVRQFSNQGALLNLTGPKDFTNPISATDVDVSAQTTALDALLIINELVAQTFSDEQGVLRDITTVDLDFFQFYDVTGDGRITAEDALRVINAIDQQEGEMPEGESDPESGLIALLAEQHVRHPNLLRADPAPKIVQDLSEKVASFGVLAQTVDSTRTQIAAAAAADQGIVAEAVDLVIQTLSHPHSQ